MNEKFETIESFWNRKKQEGFQPAFGISEAEILQMLEKEAILFSKREGMPILARKMVDNSPTTAEIRNLS